MLDKNVIISEVITKEINEAKALVILLHERIDNLKGLGVSTSIKIDDILTPNTIIGIKLRFSVGL